MGDDLSSKGSHILDGHIFTLNCCKNCIVCLKRQKINGQEAGVGPFKNKTNYSYHSFCTRGRQWWTILRILDIHAPMVMSGMLRLGKVYQQPPSFVRSFCTCSISCKRIGALKGNLHETGLNFFASLNAEFLSCCSKQKQNSVQSIIAVWRNIGRKVWPDG